MPLIVPHLAVGSGDEITIDGVTYKVPRIDAAGRLYTNTFATGASEVKAALKRTIGPSTTRVTVAAPAVGKKIRIISAVESWGSITPGRIELYFGTGASIDTNTGKEIINPIGSFELAPNDGVVWPDGAGPVGAVDDVVSMRTTVNIGADGYVTIHYREE